MGAAIAENSLTKAIFFGLPPLFASANHGAQKKVGRHVRAGMNRDAWRIGYFFHLRDERPDENDE